MVLMSLLCCGRCCRQNAKVPLRIRKVFRGRRTNGEERKKQQLHPLAVQQSIEGSRSLVHLHLDGLSSGIDELMAALKGMNVTNLS